MKQERPDAKSIAWKSCTSLRGAHSIRMQVLKIRDDSGMNDQAVWGSVVE